MDVPHPRGLPEFVGFAVRTPADPIGHPFEAQEGEVLHARAVPSRRTAFKLGRNAAHAALHDVDAADQPILAGPLRNPLWPPGVVGSISHSEEIGVALVARAEQSDGVGVDIESRRHVPELESQVIRPEERSWIDELPEDQRDDVILSVFSAKECIFKAFFPRVRTFFGFEAATVRPVEGGFEASLVADLDGAYPATRSFFVGAEWHGDTVLSWLVLPTTPTA